MTGHTATDQLRRLLDEAGEAVRRGDWQLARERAAAVLALDPANSAARTYIRVAALRLSPRAPRPPEPPPSTPTRSTAVETNVDDTTRRADAPTATSTLPPSPYLARIPAGFTRGAALELAGLGAVFAVAIYLRSKTSAKYRRSSPATRRTTCRSRSTSSPAPGRASSASTGSRRRSSASTRKPG